MPEKDNKPARDLPYNVSLANSINMNSDAATPAWGAQMTYEANHMEDLESDNKMSNTMKERKNKNHK